MRTTRERARADAELVDTGEHPELDRRLIRCACLHSLDAHEPGRPGWPPQGNRACTRCDCSRYATRPAPWRVVFRPLGGGDCSLITLWPWLVLSPRGTIAYAMAERNSALNMARSMSAVESMLTFVDQQEAELRNLLNNAMDQYREHAEQDHDGEPNPCGQALVFLDQMGMMLDPERGQAVQAGPPLDRFLAYALIAYMVERLYVKEREMARAAADILTVTQELKALKAKFEAGR